MDQHPPELRILQIASGDLWAGAEVQLYNLASALQCYRGVTVRAALMNDGELAERLRTVGVETTVLDESRHGPPGLLWRLMGVMREFRPHLVHSHREKENVLGGLANLLTYRVPAVRTVHGPREHFFKPWQVRQHLQRFSNVAAAFLLQDALAAVSHEIPRRFLPPLLPRRKVHVIENGIDIDRVRSVGRAPVPDLPGDGRVHIGFAARLVRWKRVDLFIEMAAELLRRRPEDFRFFVFGQGPLQGELEQLCRDLGVADRVHIMGFRSDVQAYLAKMDLQVITSAQEGLPMLLLELLSLEVPVIAPPVGGIPDVLGRDEYGRLVAAQEPAAYADAVEAALADPQETRRRASAALQLMYRRYSTMENARQYLALYQRLLGEAVVRPAYEPG